MKSSESQEVMMNLFRRQEFSYQIHVVRYRIKYQQMLLTLSWPEPPYGGLVE